MKRVVWASSMETVFTLESFLVQVRTTASGCSKKSVLKISSLSFVTLSALLRCSYTLIRYGKICKTKLCIILEIITTIIPILITLM